MERINGIKCKKFDITVTQGIKAICKVKKGQREYHWICFKASLTFAHKTNLVRNVLRERMKSLSTTRWWKSMENHAAAQAQRERKENFLFSDFSRESFTHFHQLSFEFSVPKDSDALICRCVPKYKILDYN